MEKGDKVLYKNDKKKIIYEIKEFVDEKAHIKGVNYRIYRIVPLEDLLLAKKDDIEKEEKESDKYYKNVINSGKRGKRRYLLGRILHIDGDEMYLEKCLELYKSLGVFAEGVRIDEKEMPDRIGYYLDKINPDIIVITGHDLYNQKGLKDIENYANTRYYMETVRKIRLKKSSYDCCVIAGACQSNFEALIASGADFASSPKRINVHTFDPAVLAIKVASTSFVRLVDIEEALKYIENGKDAYGGVETLGKMKLML